VLSIAGQAQYTAVVMRLDHRNEYQASVRIDNMEALLGVLEPSRPACLDHHISVY
jgi:hypothetical protein